MTDQPNPTAAAADTVDTTSTTDPIYRVVAAGKAFSEVYEAAKREIESAPDAVKSAEQPPQPPPAAAPMLDKETLGVILDAVGKHHLPESDEKIALRKKDAKRECVRFATGLVGKLVSEMVIDINPSDDENDYVSGMDMSNIQWAIKLVVDELTEAFFSHKFSAYEALIDTHAITR